MTDDIDQIRGGKIELPVIVTTCDSGLIIITTNEASKEIFGGAVIAHGNTIAEAEQCFWKMAKAGNRHHIERSRELNKWKPLQHGKWGTTGGNWFTVFGFHFYFRYGSKTAKYGWYVPGTTLNILFKNYWKS